MNPTVNRVNGRKMFPADYSTLPNFCLWRTFALRLPWIEGQLDSSSYTAALRAAKLGIPPHVVFAVLSILIQRAGDTVKTDKVRSQIRRAEDFVHNRHRTGPLRPPARTMEKVPKLVVTGLPRVRPTKNLAPQFDPVALAGYVAKHGPAGDPEAFIIERSPCRPDYFGCADALAVLYRGGEKVLIFEAMKSQGSALWEHDLYPGQGVPTVGPDGIWFLVNPVDGKRHPNPRLGGKLSRRSEEAVTSFRYAVLESDSAPAEQWLALLLNLELRIVAIYTSGGRSVHALVEVDALSKPDWDAKVAVWKAKLVTLGADPAALTAVRLSRLPQGWRGDRQQRLIYLNPQADGKPIREQPLRSAHDECAQRVWTLINQGLPITADLARESLATLAGRHEDPWPATVIAHLEFITGGGAF